MLTVGPTASVKAMDETKLQKYKTVLCQRMLRSGTCRYGLQCDFAHDKLELRRNLQQHWYYGQKCPKEGCEDNECRYANNEVELMYHPHVFKTQLCHSIAFGPCLKKHYCPFAHGPEELRQGKFDPENERARLFFPPPQFSTETTTTAHAAAAAAVFTPQLPLTPNLASGEALLSASRSSSTNSRDFHDTTDRLKIQLLDLVDEISSMHFDHARQSGPKSHVLEQLSQLGSGYYLNLPRSELDLIDAQCHVVLELIAQARQLQADGRMFLV